MEYWKKIDEIPNMEVSNFGRFRTKDHISESIRYGKKVSRLIKGKIRKLSKDNNGYLKLIVNTKHGMKGYVAHRLVAKYFLEDYDEGLEVDHINDIRDDNRVENLRMVSRIENIRKPSTLKRIQDYLKCLTEEEKSRRWEKSKKTMKQNGTKWGRKKKPVVKIGFNSIEFIEDTYILDGFSIWCILRACNGKRSKKRPHYYKGYEWYFQDEYIKMLGN